MPGRLRDQADRVQHRRRVTPDRERVHPTGRDKLGDAAGVVTQLLAVQQQAGNRAVATSVQRQSPGADVDAGSVGPNPLVGLRKGDGLHVGTFERRPRVKLLQHRLNERTSADLNVDGMWGDKTSDALESFQLERNTLPTEVVDPATGDALMGSEPGPGEPPGTAPPEVVPPGVEPPGVEPPGVEPPGAQPPGTAPPQAAPFNPHVESRLEAVMEEYRFIFLLQKDALRRLEGDLAEIEDAEPGLLLDLMHTAVGAVMEAFVGLTFDDLKAAIDELAAELTPEQHAATTDKASAGVAEAAKKTMDEELATTSPGVDDVAAFIETQMSGATDGAAELHRNYLVETKPAMSTLQPGEVATQDASDPRVERAEKLRKQVRKGRFRAFDIAYDQALSRWSVYLAQKAVHVTGEGSTTVGGDFGQEGTNLADQDKTSGAAGIMQLTFKAAEPDDDVTLETVEIIGLSEKVRDRLNKSDRSLDSLGFPTRAEGDLTEGEFLGIDFDPADVVMARNEVDQDFLTDDGGTDGRAWLTAKAQHEEGPLGSEGLPPSPERGAKIVLDDLMRKHTGQHPIDRG